MAITINWGTKTINVPQADLTPISGSLYELDVNAFRLTLKDLEDDPEGMAYPATHSHNTAVTLSGVTYARIVEIINGYTITFEDGQYRVRLAGANNNIPDVTNLNQVSLLAQNSAGLISAGDITSIAGSSSAASRLKESAQTMVVGAVDTTGFAPTTTQFEANIVLGYTDHVKGRAVFWRSGSLDLHAARIDGYQVVSGRGRFTVGAMPAAPASGDQFVIV